MLDRYLKEQATQLQKEVNAQFPQSDNQSVRKVLDVFVSDEGTKRPIHYQRENGQIQLREELESKMGLSPQAQTFHLLELERARILRFADDRIELAHDSLALLIDQQRTDKQRQLNDIRRSLTSDYLNWQETKEYLSNKRLERYEDFLPLLGLDENLSRFVQNSRKDAERKRAEALAQKERELQLVKEKLAAEEQQRQLADDKLAAEERARKRQNVFSFLLGIAFLIATGVGYGQCSKAR